MASTSLTSSLKIQLIDDVSKPARSVAQALKDAEREAQNVAKAMAGTGASNKLVADLSRMKLAAKDVEQVASAWRDYSRAQKLAADSSLWTKEQASGVRSWERQQLSAIRAVKREQQAFYKAQAAAMASGGGGSRLGRLAAGAKDMAGGMLMGGAPLVAGYGVYQAGKQAMKSGASYQHAVTALQNIGLTGDEMKEAVKTAQEVSRAAPGTSVTEALEQIRETIGAFGSLEHAVEHAKTLAQINSVLKASGREGVTTEGNAQNFVRYFEERGIAGNAERFQKEAKEQARAMAFFGEKYNPHEMFNFAQQAKSTLTSYNERFATKIVPSLVTMSGGEKTGTAAAMFDRTIMGRAQDKQQAAEWTRLGLLDPKQVIAKAGHPVSWKPGAVKNYKDAMHDPFAWAENTLIPAMQKGGYDTNDLDSMRKGLALLFRNQNSNFFASELALPANRQRLHKDEQLQNRAGSFEDINARNQGQDWHVANENLGKSIDNLGAAATKALPVSELLNNLARGINDFASSVSAGDFKGAGEVLLKNAGNNLAVMGGAAVGGAESWWDGKVAPGWSRVGNKLYAGAKDFENFYSGAKYSQEWRPGPSKPAPPMMTTVEGATPHVDVTQIDAVKTKADEAKGAVEGLNTTVSPHVDTGSLSAAVDLARQLNAELSRAGNLAQNARSAAASAGAALRSLGSIQRGHFGFGGVQGE